LTNDNYTIQVTVMYYKDATDTCFTKW